MAPRPYWTGRLRLSLVSIPVQLFAATKAGKKISFNQIHKKSGKRIRYEKVAPGVGPVDKDEIVKGYQVKKGKYVLLTDEDIDSVKLEAKKTIDLVQFVDQNEIDPLYFERPFFVLPRDDEDGQEAYVVLRNALRNTKKVGLGQIVVRGQSSIVALKPCGDGILLETLRYPDEIRKAKPFFDEVPRKRPAEDLINLAEQLIENKTRRFHPEDFKDSFSEALRELIKARKEKREPKEIETEEAPSNVIDLMDALKRSVKPGKSSSKKRTKRKAPRKKKAA